MNIKEILSQFFAQDDGLQKCDFLIVRNDGVVVYHHSKLEAQTAGALISGIWMASQALMELLPKKQPKDYRFSFDTSEQGVYILSIKFLQQDFYLGLFYQNETNPAQIKNKIRDLCPKLETFVNKQMSANQNGDVRKSYLFSSISDREMDALFSFAGSE